MRTEQKIRFLTWAVVVLAVLNLSTVISIIYHVHTETNQMKERQLTPGASFSGSGIIDVLDFNPEQREQFHLINNSFRESVRKINYSLAERRNSLFAELRKAKADTVKCNFISAEIGGLHKALKIKTYRFYLDVKKICTWQQQQKLNEVFAPLFSDEDRPGFKQHRGGGHHRFREHK